MEVNFQERKEISTVKWTIQNFSLCKSTVESSIFRLQTTNTSEEVEFMLEVGVQFPTQGKLSCSLLRREMIAPKNVTLNYSLTVSTIDSSVTNDSKWTFSGGTGNGGSYNGVGWTIERTELFKGESPIAWTSPLTVTLQVWSCESDDSEEESSTTIKDTISCLFTKESNPITDDFILPNDMWSQLMRDVRKMKNNIHPVPTSYFVRTRIHGERVSFTLPIRSFSAWKESDQKLLYSVISPSKKVPVLVLVLSMLADASTKDDTVQIDIRRVDMEEFKVIRLIARVAAMDTSGKNNLILDDAHMFEQNEKNQLWTLPSFLTKKKLIAEENLYLPANVLSLRFQFAFSTGEYSTETEDMSYQSPESTVSILSAVKSKI